MVSMNPSSPEGFYLESNGVALPGINPFTAEYPAAETVSSPTDDSNSKKVRKPYTISKSRESWTEPEHDNSSKLFNFLTVIGRRLKLSLGQRLSFRYVCLFKISITVC
ncbi:hypothetical protein RND81_14G110700 [Saponaria officinalis]|uniref:Uncharacterized protein n=1 Tax=Saponaria officinalis TaxID=3572 RepID=A0AAW1GWL5_SAPOF